MSSRFWPIAAVYFAVDATNAILSPGVVSADEK